MNRQPPEHRPPEQQGKPGESPPRIRVLSDAVINKIAAGEVVERPASVVKELVENALDAGASQIAVNVADGGKALISVLDNGCGMAAGDAELAVRRHATSKLRGEEELARIVTLGFRGEALASIAAVSRFELTTCAEENAGGFRVALDGGEMRETGRVGFPRGSKVSVEELFYNTPARRKFLRAVATEFQHVQGGIVNLALSHHRVHFRLVHNQRTVYDLPPSGDLAGRVYQLFGREMSEGLVPVAGAEAAFSYRGLVSHPSHSRGSRRWQYLFINGRPIRNPGINHGVYQAYRTLLMKERHPAYVLMLSLAPEEVDVNVHPAKSEVRLRNPSLIHSVLAEGLHRALLDDGRRRVFSAPHPGGGAEGHPAQPQRTLPGMGSTASVPPGRRDDPAFPSSGGRMLGDATLPAGSGGAFPRPPGDSGADSEAESTLPSPPAPAEGLRANPYGGGEFHFQPLSVPAGGGLEKGRGEGRAERPGALVEGGMNVLAQFHLTYLLVQRDEGLLLVDQHAAHERILFERYRTQFYEGAPACERYLIPLTLELSPQNALLLEQYLPQWKTMGFEFEPFGRGSFLLREIPALLTGKDVSALILEVLDELALFGKSGRLEEVLNGIMERVACHAAIRAGMALSREEMEALVEQLEGLDINLYCPHGRPVWVEFPLRELERRFKRIV